MSEPQALLFTMRKTIYKVKYYSHFDNKKDYHPWLSYICDPQNIEHHGFYPFIHFTLKSWKYDNLNQCTKIKPREINYASHIDRYIYEYYNDILNTSYNKYAKENGINKCAVAYRNNLHKNNIDIAKEAFTFLSNDNNYYIVVSDFSKYFDKIDHKYLKGCLEQVLKTEKLTGDWYKVFRSITKFCSIDLCKISTNKGISIRKLRKLDRIASIKELHDLKEHIYVNKNGYGIPQGSSISSTLSNVNLIHYDKAILQFVTTLKGFYRRYCDDSIIIVPIENRNEFLEFYYELNSSIPGLEVNKDKIQRYNLVEKKIADELGKKTWLKYLEFEFNGVSIKIREKTITAFYLKGYRSIKGINKISQKYQRNAYRKQFYQSFTHLGRRKKGKVNGNFITYVEKSAKIMNDVLIKKQISHHWRRFEKRLSKSYIAK
jgi:hypothetical protein